MTVTLRTTSNTKATNKSASLTHSELDGNFVHFLDTGITVVGDDSSGTEFTPGDDLKIAGADTFTLDTEKIVLEGGDRVIAVSQSPANLPMTISYLQV